MKTKYVKLIIPFITVIGSVCCMLAYRPPLPVNPSATIQKLPTAPPADGKNIHDADDN